MSDKCREAFEKWKRSEEGGFILSTTLVDAIAVQAHEAGYQAGLAAHDKEVREMCAKLCEGVSNAQVVGKIYADGYRLAKKECAKAIRAMED